MLFYPLYALLFARTGLSTAAISSLFVIWSVATFALEVPSGLWADLFSRRAMLTLAPLLCGAGYGLWTVLPSYPTFALGFVLWGAGSALRSGTLQALVYEELERAGATRSYARLMGRAEALRTTAMLLAAPLAAPVLAAGGYGAVGGASVLVCLLGAAVARTFPEPRTARRVQGGSTVAGLLAVLREGTEQVRVSGAARRAVLLVSAVSGLVAIDEYVPLLLRSMDAGEASVPLLLLPVYAGVAAGGWCAGRGARWLGPALALGAAAMAVGALCGSLVPGTLLLAFSFGVFQWGMVTADALLQDRIADSARATVASMAGFGAEAVAMLLSAGYAAGSALWEPGMLFALAALAYLPVAFTLTLSLVPRRTSRTSRTAASDSR